MLSVDISVRQGDFELDAAFRSEGGVTALFGASGSGKSTIVRAVAGLTRPKAGRIALDGEVLFDAERRINMPVHRRRVGLVFQESLLFPHLSVKSNLTYGHWAGGRVMGDLDEVVELLGIGHLLARKPGTLSGGERQRVAIGRALLSSPDVLLMDEPLAALDAPRKAEILPWLDRLKHETSLPILYVSHSISEVARLADSMVVLSEGRLLAAGALADVMQLPELSSVFGPAESGALLEATVVGQDAIFGLTELAIDRTRFFLPHQNARIGSRLRLRILARDVALALGRPEGTSFQNCLPGAIETISEVTATDDIVTVRIGETGSIQRLNAQVTRKSAARMALRPGLAVWCLVKGVAMEPRLVSPE